MVDEQKKLHSNRLSPNPDDLDWSNLKSKVNLDIFWLKDESLEDSENLPEPDVLAQEIVENLQSALEQFSSIYEDLSEKEVSEQF